MCAATSVTPMGNFIREHYDVIFASEGINQETFEDVEEFLLANDMPTLCEETNALFINTFAREEDLVLMQEDDYEKPLEHRRFYQLLNTPAKKAGYSARTKTLRQYAWFFKICAEQNQLQAKFFKEEDPQKLHELAAKIFCISSLTASLTNSYQSLPLDQKNSLEVHQQSILETLNTESVKLSKRKFLHVHTRVLFSPKSFLKPPFGTELVQSNALKILQELFPPSIYEGFHQTLNHRKVVILTTKVSIIEKVEIPRIQKLEIGLKNFQAQIYQKDESAIQLIDGDEHQQVLTTAARALRRSQLFLNDPRSVILTARYRQPGASVSIPLTDLRPPREQFSFLSPGCGFQCNLS